MHEYLPPKNTQEAAASIGILFFEMLQRNTGHSWEKKIHTDTPFPEETFILLQSHLSRFWLKIGTISPDDFNLWNELYIIFESIYTPGNAKHLLALCKKISSAQQEPVITQYGALPGKTTELLLPCIKNTTIETAKGELTTLYTTLGFPHWLHSKLYIEAWKVFEIEAQKIHITLEKFKKNEENTLYSLQETTSQRVLLLRH